MNLWYRVRRYFLTGAIALGPLAITLYLAWWFVSLFDSWLKPLVPSRYNPDTYLEFSVPGVGIVLAFAGVTLFGALTANLIGRTVFGWWSGHLDRMPILRSVYKAARRIFETVLSDNQNPFQEPCLVEFPRKGVYALAFLTRKIDGRLRETLGGREYSAVFLPTAPNPTSGLLLMFPDEEITRLDVGAEKAAGMIISAGLAGLEEVSSDDESKRRASTP